MNSLTSRSFVLHLRNQTIVRLRPSFPTSSKYCVENLNLLRLVKEVQYYSSQKIYETKETFKIGSHCNGSHLGVYMPRIALIPNGKNSPIMSIAEGHSLIAYLIKNGITKCPVEMKTDAQVTVLVRCSK